MFYCWRCGQKISVPEFLQGKLLPCPGCERLLTVPPGADVPKRVTPLQEPEDVVVTDSDITFDCVHCDYLLVADVRGAGRMLPCPGCGRMITVPHRKPAQPPRDFVEEPAVPTEPFEPAPQDSESSLPPP